MLHACYYWSHQIGASCEDPGQISAWVNHKIGDNSTPNETSVQVNHQIGGWCEPLFKDSVQISVEENHQSGARVKREDSLCRDETRKFDISNSKFLSTLDPAEWQHFCILSSIAAKASWWRNVTKLSSGHVTEIKCFFYFKVWSVSRNWKNLG